MEWCGLYVCCSHLWALQKRLDRSRCHFGGWLRWAQGTMCQMGIEILYGNGQFWGLSGHWKHWESVLWCFRQQKIDNSDCGSQLKCSRLDGVTYVVFFEKSAPAIMCYFIKILWSLVEHSTSKNLRCWLLAHTSRAETTENVWMLLLSFYWTRRGI